MALFDSFERGLGLFQSSGASKLFSPKVQELAETALGATRQTVAAVSQPPQQGVPQGKPVVQANVTPMSPAQVGVGEFLKANRGPLMILGAVALGYILVKKLL